MKPFRFKDGDSHDEGFRKLEKWLVESMNEIERNVTVRLERLENPERTIIVPPIVDHSTHYEVRGDIVRRISEDTEAAVRMIAADLCADYAADIQKTIDSLQDQPDPPQPLTGKEVALMMLDAQKNAARDIGRAVLQMQTIQANQSPVDLSKTLALGLRIRIREMLRKEHQKYVLNRNLRPYIKELAQRIESMPLTPTGPEGEASRPDLVAGASGTFDDDEDGS